MKILNKEDILKIDLRKELDGRLLSASDLAPDLMEELSKSLEEINGIPLEGWPFFNAYFGGLRPSELTMVTSDTGMGKTTFAQNVAANILMQGKSVLYIALENRVLDVLKQIATMSTREELADKPTKENKEVLNLFCNSDGQRLFFLEQSYDTSSDLVLKSIVHCKKYFNIDLVVLDHLDAVNLRLSSGAGITHAQSVFMRNLHNTTKHSGVHTIAIQHPAKLGDKGGYGEKKKRQDRHITIDEIKGSSSFKQYSDVIFTIRRPSEYENCTEINLQKMRYSKYGRNIEKTVKYVMNPNTYHFEEMGLYDE